MINITGLEKARVFKALYNASRTQGNAFIHFDPKPMTDEEAREFLNKFQGTIPYFDYVKGRIMKVDIGEDKLDPCLYDRDNGEGAAEMAILREFAGGD